MGFFNTITNWLLDFGYDYKDPNMSQEQHDAIHKSAKARWNESSNNADSEFNTAFSNSLRTLLDGYQTSALKAEKDATKSAQEWQKQQNDLAWSRSLSSAKAQMDFQKQQNDLAWERSQSSAREQMAFQEKMWNKTVDYNTDMANTQYQRLVNDLRKSGINPVLAINKGGSSVPNATVPSGASASAHAMSGASATASAPSGYKADYSSAKNSDVKVGLFDIFTGSLTSALKALLK